MHALELFFNQNHCLQNYHLLPQDNNNLQLWSQFSSSFEKIKEILIVYSTQKIVYEVKRVSTLEGLEAFTTFDF